MISLSCTGGSHVGLAPRTPPLLLTALPATEVSCYLLGGRELVSVGAPRGVLGPRSSLIFVLVFTPSPPRRLHFLAARLIRGATHPFAVVVVLSALFALLWKPLWTPRGLHVTDQPRNPSSSRSGVISCV